MSDDKKAKPKASKSAEKLTPDAWAQRLGKLDTFKCMGRTIKQPSWQHAVADVNCGWRQHQHDANEPFQLTEADYLAALEAAEAPPYKPPAGARSPFCKLHKE